MAARKFGEFDKPFVVRQTLTSQALAYDWYPYDQNLSIHQTFFCQLLLPWQLTKHSRYTLLNNLLENYYVCR